MKAIDDKHAQLGGTTGFLGQPTSAHSTCPDLTGRFRHYAGGSIYWHPDTGAHEVHGAILDRWKSLGWELSWLGYPTTDEGPLGNDGRVSHFQNGVIEWRPTAGVVDKEGVGVVEYRDVTHSGHQKYWDDLHPKGWKMISLAVYGAPADPRYAAVWTTHPAPDQAAIHGASESQYVAWRDLMASRGYHVVILTATGAGAVFAAVAEKTTGSPPVAKHGLVNGGVNDPKSFQRWCAWAKDNRFLPRSIDLYGSAGELIAVVFEPNLHNVAWSADDVAVDVAREEVRFGVLTRHGARPYLTARSASSRYISIYRDDLAGPWFSKGQMTAADYYATTEKESKNGYYPVWAQAEGTSDARFTVVFGKRRRLPDRSVVTGPSSTSLNALDEATLGYMKRTNLRAASVAVAKGSKLLYARGFTWAPPGYEITQPSSIFRVGSCSKVLTSILIHQLVEDVASFDLTDKVVDVLDLDPPPGMTTAAKWSDVTIEHLLSHLGGVPSNFAHLDVQVAAAFGKKIPEISKREIASYLTTQSLVKDPGTVSSYANSGYLLLAAVVEHLTGKSWFGALKERILTPLGLTRPAVSGSALEQRAPHEVVYHDRHLSLRSSVMAPDQPLVVDGYGNVNLAVGDGVGGMAFGAADFVKILSAFSLPSNPILSQAMRDVMWQQPPGFPMAGAARGWGVRDWGGGVFEYGHGGGLSNAHAVIAYRTDGVSLAAFFNGDVDRLQPMPAYFDLIDDIATWPSTDRFAEVGIPAH
jgi:CubicO group peptidase (beta-lactamase class C family)